MSKLEKTHKAYTLAEKLGHTGQVGEGEIQISEGSRVWHLILSVRQDPFRFRTGWWSVRKRVPFGAWYREAIQLMQGQSTIAENLRFDWAPVLVWKTRPDDSLQAILFGWNKSIFLTRNSHSTGANGIVITQDIVEEYVFEYYYNEPQKQRVEDQFSEWLSVVYNNDKPYFQHTLWVWIEDMFEGQYRGIYQCPI